MYPVYIFLIVSNISFHKELVHTYIMVVISKKARRQNVEKSALLSQPNICIRITTVPSAIPAYLTEAKYYIPKWELSVS